MFKHRYRLVVALLLFFAGMLNYMDRAALSVMAPLVKADLHLNDAQLGCGGQRRRYRRAGGRSGWSGFRLAHRLRGYRPARSGLGMRMAVAVSR